MIYGNDILDHLASLAGGDVEESAHWQYYNRNFTAGRVAEDALEISGDEGFGGNYLNSRRLKKAFNWALQSPYRAMLKRHRGFKELDKLCHSVMNDQRRLYDLNVLRQVLTLSCVFENGVEEFLQNDEHRLACVIGDGYGTLTTLLLKSGRVKGVCLVNLRKQLLVDLLNVRKPFGERWFEKSVMLLDVNDVEKIDRLPPDIKLVACMAENAQNIKQLPICLFFNVVSMQEMNPSSIASYFETMRLSCGGRSKYFYCCNRLEKTFSDGTRTKFNEYPWSDSDEILIDELCPWHQKYYAFRPPFYRPYDGPIWHRLVKLSGISG